MKGIGQMITSRIAKTLARTVAAFALVGAMHAVAHAQSSSATTSASATAVIVAPIAISKTTDLHFGNVVAGGTSGTVLLTPGGVRSATGGTVLGNAGATAAAVFAVSGQGSATYSITLPVAASTLTDGGPNSMTVDTWTCNPTVLAGALSVGGTENLDVGATLNVGANQVAGTYTGTFSITVTYN